MYIQKFLGKISAFLFVIISVCLTGFLGYKYADKLISYEYSSEIPSSSEKTPVEPAGVCTSIEEIPECDSYTMVIKDRKICICNSDGTCLYTLEQNSVPLSEEDKTKLTTGGIKFTARKELIELLYYLES